MLSVRLPVSGSHPDPTIKNPPSALITGRWGIVVSDRVNRIKNPTYNTLLLGCLYCGSRSGFFGGAFGSGFLNLGFVAQFFHLFLQ
ncbi:hypothetical protein EV681_1754 [Advenella incenata]|uniref:Uncharacterized protein n=1 Tax=Advenella incenata TaxID=267800 RepID=A0A4Q7VUJ4_9BURK|nr:hypothetical protein EV681_1754 [Advenella incenata]